MTLDLIVLGNGHVHEVAVETLVSVLSFLEAHDGGGFVLFSHHFDSLLSAIKIELIVLLFLLNLH